LPIRALVFVKPKTRSNMRTVYLKDHVDTVRQECIKRNDTIYYPVELIDRAIHAQIGNELRYRNGKTYDKCFGVCSEYVNDFDIPNYEEESTCALWEFSGIVMNSAGRLHRGYSAI
jgi:hypothetical protein